MGGMILNESRLFKNKPSKICQPSKNLNEYGLPNEDHTSQNLLRKSMDWFLYDIGLRHERVKGLLPQILLGPFLN